VFGTHQPLEQNLKGKAKPKSRPQKFNGFTSTLDFTILTLLVFFWDSGILGAVVAFLLVFPNDHETFAVSVLRPNWAATSSLRYQWSGPVAKGRFAGAAFHAVHVPLLPSGAQSGNNMLVVASSLPPKD
jgi:hypothetical protein